MRMPPRNNLLIRYEPRRDFFCHYGLVERRAHKAVLESDRRSIVDKATDAERGVECEGQVKERRALGVASSGTRRFDDIEDPHRQRQYRKEDEWQ